MKEYMRKFRMGLGTNALRNVAYYHFCRPLAIIPPQLYFVKESIHLYDSVCVCVCVSVCACTQLIYSLMHPSSLSNIFCASDIVLQVGPTVVSLDCWVENGGDNEAPI